MEIEDNESQSTGSGLKWALGAVLIVMVIAGGVGFARISRERAQLSDLTVANQSLTTSLVDLRAQVQSMTAKLDEQAAAARQEAAARAAAVASVRPRNPSGAPPRATGSRPDPRFNQIQSRLEEQQKAIASNREDLTKARDDLQGKLDSTRSELSGSISSSHDELSGSIARTHDDIVALQKRGERNYYEFTLNKSKDFRRVGPLSLSVRKVDTKRKSYDLAMFVDDNQLQKKSVNLFEPVWINLQDQSQPVQLVVNQISKDQIQGYISAPKYKRSELGDTASTGSQPLPATQPALKQP
jgi:hypothetical protein